MPDLLEPPPPHGDPLWPFILVAAAVAVGLFTAGVLLTLDIGSGYAQGSQLVD